jgi:hypothetical protein
MSIANFDRYFQRLGMIKISKVTFRKIIKAAPRGAIEQASHMLKMVMNPSNQK